MRCCRARPRCATDRQSRDQTRARQFQKTAAVDIAAPVETIWATVTDCERAHEMSPNLKSCRVLQRAPADVLVLPACASHNPVAEPLEGEVAAGA